MWSDYIRNYNHLEIMYILWYIVLYILTKNENEIHLYIYVWIWIVNILQLLRANYHLNIKLFM